jgi:hypothetical protein
MKDAGQRAIEAGRTDTAEFISIREASRRSSMSEKTIRNFIRYDALPHWRNSKAGKIWLRWTDFVAWMERRRIELRHDDQLLGILREMAKARR